MEIKVRTSDEPQPSMATVPNTPAALGIIQPSAAVEAPPAPAPPQPVTEPAVPPATPDPLPSQPEPFGEPPAPDPMPAPFNPGLPLPPDAPLNRTPLPEKKRPKLPVVVLIAVVVVVAIAAVVVFAFMRSRDSGLQTPAITTTAPTVDSSDVSSASADIDKSLQTVDDSKDFSSSDISDQTLGL